MADTETTSAWTDSNVGNDNVSLLTRRASLKPRRSVEARTVEVVWSTGAPVRRRDMAGNTSSG
jgi:hypothetical protein